MRSMCQHAIELTRESNGVTVVDGHEALDQHSIANFSQWHEGWSVTEFSAPGQPGSEPHAVFQGLEWDPSSRMFEVLLVSHDLNGVERPDRIHLGNVIRVQVSLFNGCHPERVIRFDMQTGECALMRIKLDRELRKLYEEVCLQETN